MDIQNSNIYDEIIQYCIQLKEYVSQEILSKDHICNSWCLDYSSLQFFSLRLKQRTLNEALSLDKAFQVCSEKLEIIQQNKNLIKRAKGQINSIHSQTPFPSINPSSKGIKKIITKMQLKQIPIFTQFAILGIPVPKLIQISNGLEKYSNSQQDVLFTFSNQHLQWLKEYLIAQYQEKLSNCSHILRDFLNQFQLSEQCIIGNENPFLKIWQPHKLSLKIDRTKLTQRINIIGTSGRELLIYQFFKCYVDAVIFKNFLIQLIQIYNNKYGRKNYFFTMDNASIHKEQSIQKNVLEYVEHLFLPPYSPLLNPIERLWSQFKCALAKKSCRTGIKLNQEIHNRFKNLTDNQLQKNSESIYKVIEQCLMKQEL